MQTLSVRNSVSFGWETFKSRPWFFIGISVLVLLIGMVLGGLEETLNNLAEAAFGPQAAAVTLIAIVAALFSFGASALLELGRTVLFLRAHDRAESVSVRDLWQPEHFWSYFGTMVMFTVMILVGFVLLIVPGIILGIIFGFSLYLVAEKGLMPIDAFKESARITKGNRWNLFLLGLALLGVNILGALALLVGLFVSLPVSFLAVVHAYRTLSSAAPVATETPKVA